MLSMMTTSLRDFEKVTRLDFSQEVVTGLRGFEVASHRWCSSSDTQSSHLILNIQASEVPGTMLTNDMARLANIRYVWTPAVHVLLTNGSDLLCCKFNSFDLMKERLTGSEIAYNILEHGSASPV